jgi:hypothetical protein
MIKIKRQRVGSRRRTGILGTSFVMAVAAWSVATTLNGQPADPRMGTWTLNLAKSTYPAGLAPRSQTLKWEPAGGDGFKLTTDGVDAQGQTIHTETVAKLDGKDYPIDGGRSGGPARTRATRRLDDYTFESIDRFEDVNGQVVSLVRLEKFSSDGKSMTNTSSRRDPKGQVVRIVAVYERR